MVYSAPWCEVLKICLLCLDSLYWMLEILKPLYSFRIMQEFRSLVIFNLKEKQINNKQRNKIQEVGAQWSSSQGNIHAKVHHLQAELGSGSHSFLGLPGRKARS